MATVLDAHLGLWRDYSRHHRDREQDPVDWQSVEAENCATRMAGPGHRILVAMDDSICCRVPYAR